MTVFSYAECGTDFIFKVKGHAGYAKEGDDIVCAAVSALVCTLYEKLKCMDIRLKSDIKSADVYIQAHAEGRESEVRAVFDVILTGLKLLKETYPDYVREE